MSVLLLASVSCEAAQVAAAPVAEVEPVVAAAATAVAADGDAGIVAEHPSWAYYPAIDPTLIAAIAGDERADVVLRMLAATLAPHRWASVDDWDNTGFVNLEPDAPAGWVTRASGTLASQLAGEFQLGCAGGYLEGVRAILVPDLRMGELKRCDGEALAVLGEHAPTGCRPEEFGLHAIVATAAAVERRGASTAPPVFVHVEPTAPEAFDTTLVAGAVHVCTVSHRSRAFGDARYYHHLMIVVRPTARATFQVFDTTGYGGVQVREMTGRKLGAYSKNALAMNRHHDYDPASTRVDCFAINRRR